MKKLKTPEVLYGALRQYRHNQGDDELVAGFDHDETVELVSNLQEEVRRLRDAESLLRKILDTICDGICWSTDNPVPDVRRNEVKG